MKEFNPLWPVLGVFLGRLLVECYMRWLTWRQGVPALTSGFRRGECVSFHGQSGMYRIRFIYGGKMLLRRVSH